MVVRGGSVVSSQGVERVDVGINGQKIEAVGDLTDEPGVIEIDATNLHVFPGLIDTQVHFREPGMEHKEDIESGTRAAIAGGVTTIFEMPNTIPPTTTKEALQDKLKRAKGRAWCDYAFFVGAATDNIDQLASLEMEPGTPGIKIFMGSSTGSLLVPDDDNLRQVLKHGKQRCPVHAEDHYRLEERKKLLSEHPHVSEHPNIRDAECARMATERLLRLSEETGRPVHILHVSTKDELPLIEKAKKQGLNTTCEITPQHLLFAHPEWYTALGKRAQMNPPIRSHEHRDALRQALRDGLFDVIGSDHAPHTIDEKALPYPQSPSGMPGVQTILPVMLSCVNERFLTLEKLVQMACENPCLIYGIAKKGFIKPGYDADICVVDLQAERTVDKSWLESKCGWSPYEFMNLRGWPLHTILRGHVIVRDNEFVGNTVGKPVNFTWKH